MKTWKTNLEETKQRYINWWNHKGIILSMWETLSGRRETARRQLLHLLRQGICRRSGFDPQWRGGISGLGMSLTVV